jgi:hypothetical protein
MKEANYGTLIIEEADSVTDREIESILITRYSKASADSKKMVSEGKDWNLQASPTFGATIVHRRNLFRDPAMLRRVITVQTKRKKGISFIQVTKDTHAALFAEYRRQFGFRITWPDVSNEWGLEQAIFDCYKPLITLAKLTGDAAFLDSLVSEMRHASDRLVNEESYLEVQVLLKALIHLVDEKVKGNVTANRINIEINKIDPAIREEFGANCPVLKLSANQRNRILREDLGFVIRSSHGRNRLYLDIPQLIKACEDNAVEDDLLAEWKTTLSSELGSEEPAATEDTSSEENSDPWETEEK